VIYRIFDIETEPDTDLWQPPPEEPGKFPPQFAHKMIALAWVDIEMIPAPGTQEVHVHSLATCFYGKDGEAAMLRDWGHTCGRTKPVLVTWNGRKFDGPVMALRAMKHSIPWAWWYSTEPNYRYRYGHAHLDLQDVLLDFTGGGMKLSDVAHLCGLPGKTIMTGGDVSAEAKAGNYKKIGAYCLADVVMTAGVFLCYQAQRGLIDSAAVERTLDSLADPSQNRLIAMG
jgi:hypothetical protein